MGILGRRLGPMRSSAYARQAEDTELGSWASEIKLRAVRRMGERLEKTVRPKGGGNHLVGLDMCSDSFRPLRLA